MATARESISKRMRFEIFKRDKFTCQYCGRSAPDVMLEVDHVIPVSKGGTNDILNLVTSCKDCNRGKSNKELSDDSAIKKQQKQIEELSEKSEQLEMLLKWRENLKGLKEQEVDSFCKQFRDATGEFEISDSGRAKVKKWLNSYTIIELLDALDESLVRYFDGTGESASTMLSKVPKIAYYKKHPMNDVDKNVFYLRKILINRFRKNGLYMNERVAFTVLKKALENGISFEELKDTCKVCRNWSNFKNEMEGIIGEADF